MTPCAHPFATFSSSSSTWSTGVASGGGSLGAQITVSGSAIPEPSTYAAFAGGAALAAAGYSRRRATRRRKG